MRACSKCGAQTPPDGFYRGYAQCKPCVRARVETHRLANLERVRAYDRERARRPKTKERIARIAERWRQTHPEWRKAQYTVGNAVRDGILVRPKKCSRCRAETRVQAHHWDYSRPLVVEWVCKPCHAQADKERREVAA